MDVVDVSGVSDISDTDTAPYIVVAFREKVDDNMTREKLLIRAGTGQTFEKFSRSMWDKGHHFYLAGEGRIQHFKKDKKLVIYSMTGEHKLTYILLKEKFPDYHTVWRDG